MNWVVLIWNVLMALLTIGAIAFAHSHHSCQSFPNQICNQATSDMTTIGVWVVVAIWLIGDVPLGGLWLATKQTWRVCPECGLPLGNGSEPCEGCGALLAPNGAGHQGYDQQNSDVSSTADGDPRPSSSPGTSIYRMYSFWDVQLLGMSVIFGIVAIALLVSAARGGEPGWPFAIFWSAGAAFLFPFFLLKVVYELRLVDGATFTWKTTLRSGSLPVSSVRDVRPFFGGGSAEVIEFDDGHRIIVMMRKGFVPFLDDLSRAVPSLSVNVSPSWSRLAERWPFQGRGGYEHWD